MCSENFSYGAVLCEKIFAFLKSTRCGFTIYYTDVAKRKSLTMFKSINSKL
ncbi:hypothetical protein HMPREF9554_00896 [Treponema phagedenis F0421]|nr:hypothetical protein HMPREF9554_00896 [Treponema phagedenis F0421]